MRSLFALPFVALQVAMGSAAIAEPASFTFSGTVRDGETGRGLSGATLVLKSPGDKTIISSSSDEHGSFSTAVPSLGTYLLVVTARGYRSASLRVKALAGGAHRPIVVTLESSSRLRAIGGTASRESGFAPPFEQSVSTANAATQGALRIADVLGRLPGVDLSGDAAAPGGDAYIGLRGLRPGESRVLLDGHPIGPLGVAVDPPDADGSVPGFNFADAPSFALRAVDISFASGAGSTFGGAPVGGTIDLKTIDPSKRLDLGFEQGFGSEGRSESSVHVTGTRGKVAFVVAAGVEGTFGLFDGTPIAQTGLRGTDFTSATLRALTYDVSGDYLLHNGLAKIVYAAAPHVTLSLTGYDATSWSDKTGEGDNDAIPYTYALANAPVGGSPHCPAGVLVTTDRGSSCLTTPEYAAASSGPAGGGPGAWQALINSDYDARASIGLGTSTLSVDVFADLYAELYHRSASLISGPLDAFLDRYATRGASVSDVFSATGNALTLGADWVRQTLDGDTTTPAGTSSSAYPTTARTQARAFVRDAYAVTHRLTLSIDAGLNAANIDPRSSIDPRFSAIFRPDSRDVLRFSSGRSIDDPSLQTDRLALSPIGALNPDCGAIARATSSVPATVAVGTGPSPHLGAESATDLEIGLERRLGADADTRITIYDTNVTNRIVTAQFAAGTELPETDVAPLSERIASFCGLSPVPEDIVFTLNRAFNAATSRLRGIELDGHARVSDRVMLDYSYDIASVVLNDLPSSVLATDPTLVNGTQAFGVPLHKANLGVEFSPSAGFRLRLDAHAVGQNNPAQVGGYAYVDGSIAQTLTRNVGAMLAISNIFNSHAQTYGLVGSAVPYATNPFYARLATPFLQPFNERYGLAPMTVLFDATFHT